MSSAHTTFDSNETRLRRALQEYWGYDGFLPLQKRAMESALEGKDSLVVLPTGGGKSLCFQAPAVCQEGLTLVISPLISLMKDQVDTLRACGISADFSNSSQSYDERLKVAQRVREGRTKLLYLAPERLVTDSAMSFLNQCPPRMIAIDEAHCISAWGHDFRPEYRSLGHVRETLNNVSVHAYTATATERVRMDIIEQLGLKEPELIVGSFDRPNLLYRVQRRSNRLEQIRNVIRRHENESGIVYCITRADVEKVCSGLNKRGIRAAAYHAGLDDEVRKNTQDAFINDRVDVIVATIAFGMGIDKPNVRFVVHCGMPKSLENYQQEAGRAGRDGLEAECVMFYSGHDYHVWKSMLESSQESANGVPALSSIYQYCSSVTCRHESLVKHFGQSIEQENCGACDVCLGEIATIAEPIVTAQMIVSCVARLGQRFGGEYTSLVLNGSTDQRILERGHNELSTWGLLKEHDQRVVRDWIEQLVEQEFLRKCGEYNTLEITVAGHSLLKGEMTPRLLEPPKRKRAEKARRGAAAASWEGVDKGLFDCLRELRKLVAQDRGVPAYVIFGDNALREMARIRPSNQTTFFTVRGVGASKLEQFGERFVTEINRYCRENELSQDQS